MAKTPLRPVRYMFVFGKGKTKARRESDNPTQYLLEQVTLSSAEDNFKEISTSLRRTIESDVRAELVNVAAAFRRTIGLAGYHRGLEGVLKPKSIGGDDISLDLGSLPRWAPRGAVYLADKRKATGHRNWFDNSGWGANRQYKDGTKGGFLKQFFAAQKETTGAGTEVYVGSGGIFEEIFGKITVQIQRNIKGAGVNAGTIKVGGGRHIHMQLASVRVRALGQLTDSMLRFSEQPNTALLNKISQHSAQGSIAALHLRGGRGRYRPTMEPYLKWFLQKALPHAVQQRIVKGTGKGRLTR